jgi:hypothetical protein
MGHIFISYSHKDTKYAHGLASHLKNMGFDIWIDERLDYGSQWPLEIQKQLDSCDVFILIMTPRSFASDWVQSELQRAKRKLKPIFPLLLEGHEPWLSVESTQYYDVRGEKFPDTRFYSAIKSVVSSGKAIQVIDKLPKAAVDVSPVKPRLRMKTEVIVAIIGGIATVIAACAAMVGPLVGWMNREPALAEASLPSTVVTQLTPQQLLTTSATFLPSPMSTSTIPPTRTNVPPTTVTLMNTPTHIPTFTPTATQPPQSVCDQYETIPLQLYWSEERQDNITVASSESINGATSANYRFVSTEGYVLQNPQSGTLPLVLYYEGYTSFDNFTVATSEGIAQAISAGYWRVRDHVEGYIFTTQYPGTIPLNLYYHFERSDNFTTASNTGQADANTWNYQFIRTEGYICP